jgi:hypothetical protein
MAIANNKKILNNYDRFTGVPFNASIHDELPQGVEVDNAIWFKNLPEFGGGFAKRDFEDGFVNPEWFGAVPNDLEKDYTEILQRILNFEHYPNISFSGAYQVTDLIVPSNKTLKCTDFKLIQKSLEPTGSTLLSLGDDINILGDITLDGNNLMLIRPDNSKEYIGLEIGNRLKADHIRIENTFNFTARAVGKSGISIDHLTETGMGRGALLLRCSESFIGTYISKNANMIFPKIYQHCLDMFYCNHIEINSYNVFDVKSYENTTSKAITGITMGGNSFCKINSATFSGYHSDLIGLPIAEDGGYGNIITNVLIRGWNLGVGLEVQGSSFCTFANWHIDATNAKKTEGTSVGMHVSETGISGAFTDPKYLDLQSRDRGLANNNTFDNFTVVGCYASFRIAGNNNIFRNCSAIGNDIGWRIQSMQSGVATSYWKSPIEEKVINNRFIDCQAEQCKVGFMFWGGRNVQLVNPRIRNCGIGLNNFLLKYFASSVAATINTITGESDVVPVIPNMYNGYHIFISDGTSVGDLRKIISHTATVYTIEGNFTNPPIGSEFVIAEDQGDIHVLGGQIFDDQDFTMSGVCSFSPAITDVANLKEVIIVNNGDRIAYNQKFKIKNVITGASSPDLIVQCINIDPDTRDRIHIKVLSLGDGSPPAGTLTPPLVPGTGTISTANVSWTPTAFLTKLIGNGGKFTEEIDGHYWLKIGTDNAQVLSANIFSTNVEYLLTDQLSQTYNNVPFQIVKCDIEGIPLMVDGLNFNKYHGDVVVSDDVVIKGEINSKISQYRSRSVNEIELTPNVSVPKLVGIANKYVTNNTSAVTLTNFSNSIIGRKISIRANDSNTTLGFQSSNLKGYTRNVKLNVGDIVEATSLGSSWMCKIMRIDGRLPLFDVGEKESVTPSIIEGGKSGTDLLQFKRTDGVIATWGIAVRSFLTFRDAIANIEVFAIARTTIVSNPPIPLNLAVLGIDKSSVAFAGRIAGESVIGTVPNSPGGDIYVSAGRGTGSAPSSKIIFSTPGATTAGTTTQTWVERGRFSETGALVLGSIPDQPSSVFTVGATAKGSVPFPRLTTQQREAIVSPTNGLFVYDTNTQSLWLYNGSAWIPITTNRIVQVSDVTPPTKALLNSNYPVVDYPIGTIVNYYVAGKRYERHTADVWSQQSITLVE